MKVSKLVQVSRRVSRVCIKHNTGGSLSKTIQRSTVKYAPFIMESIQSGSVDVKTFENTTAELVACDILIVAINIAVVLCRKEFKKRV